MVGLVEIDLESFKIMSDLRLPAGTSIFPVEGTKSVLLPSYYYDEIYEVSLTDMEFIRTIEAEASIFSIEYDQKRGLIYATSRTSGHLQVIDYDSGKTLKKVAVGAKPEPLYFDRAMDRLYTGSKLGIIQIDLGEFLRN